MTFYYERDHLGRLIKNKNRKVSFNYLYILNFLSFKKIEVYLNHLSNYYSRENQHLKELDYKENIKQAKIII